LFGRDKNGNYKIVVRVVVGGEREAREGEGKGEGMDVDDEEECRATVSSWANLWSWGLVERDYGRWRKSIKGRRRGE
jgi:hypothetical protein